MFLTKLFLSHFRSFESRLFEFKTPTTILVGPNAAGKTSIIEAIDLLATGDSFRAGKIEEMIEFEEELGRAKGQFAPALDEINSKNPINLEVLLTRGQVQGKRTRKRLFSINETRRSKHKFVGQFQTVVFRPEDMRLIEGSKRRRRDFMDTPLSLLSQTYLTALSTYTQALSKRNKLLSQIREGEMPRSTLGFWTMTILKHGQILQKQRQEFLDFFKTVEFPLPFSVEYQPSLMTQARMDKYAEREIAAGYTLIGPHKDELVVKLAVKTEKFGEKKRDIAAYGSRGQQRLGVLWLKTCELAYLEKKTSQKSLLLLDDVLSELDETHQDLVLELINGRQTFITTADQESAQKIKHSQPESKLIKL